MFWYNKKKKEISKIITIKIHVYYNILKTNYKNNNKKKL